MSTPTAAQISRFQNDFGTAAEIQVVNTKPTQEYVAGGYLNTTVNQQTARILSNNIDEIMRLLGPHTYEQMATTDAEIAKCLTVLKTYVLSDNITITPAVPQHHEDFKQAKDLADFCNRAVSNLDTRLVDVAEQLLDCLVYGHKVGEITYQLMDNGQDAGKLLLKSIKVKKQTAIAFVVDQFNNVLGFKAAQLGNDIPISGKTKVIPREKFLVFSFRCKDSDPRGTSILRAVYNAWHLKMTMWPEYLRWLTNCAIPGLVGIAAKAEDQEKQYVMKDGEPVTDAGGNPIILPATSQLANALEQLRNASVIAVPYGSDVKPIANQTSSEPFQTARDVLNEEIEMAILLQTLATSDSAHNTRAASQTAMTVLDVLVFHLKGIVADSIRRDLITNLVAYNFGNVKPELLPQVSLGDTERRSWSIDGVAAGTMFANQLIKDSQLPGIWRQLGIDPPAEDDTGLNVAGLAKQPQTTTGPGVSKSPTNKTNNAVQANKTKSKANTPTNKAAAGQ